ncbi:hypothetical protein SAMN04488057_107211 [Cyclobacterium lianum]|uniref:Heparinase II/III-like protein n=1 Tax=Cyclobacterium lianum TaxID=388280 RepID=A0A1M7PA47_9BACT|nr:hypothetical protein [Cyclobacterium lianum]SHN13630.1 hypothetical protein SAMN04488057_107211 [Cyclobacterium lianum]
MENGTKERVARSLFFCFLWMMLSVEAGSAQQLWELDSYPDESGFQKRSAGMVQQLAKEPFGQRSQGTATCPDTGLPFKTWALEGETVYSPYTGRALTQGPTGYFGPKERAGDGQIGRFGGDALKKDLIPAIARLLTTPGDDLTKAWLSIPGNLQQQYHFAAKNWARFYPLLGHYMAPDWHKKFQHAVASYAANDRPSDGYRKYAPLSTPHNLVGEPGELLGGNPKDGGTENHKIMWRTAAWLYAQHFPDSALISGWPVQEVDSLMEMHFRTFYQKLLETGNGEYDAEIYYPHSLEALMNVYDFARNNTSKELAKGILDYFLATVALKAYDGAIAGAQKRAPQPMNAGGELSSMLHLWFGNTQPPAHKPSVHQLTSGYRPAKFIWDLYHKRFPLPFVLKVSRPSYHLDRSDFGQEYFYGSRSFGIGSISQTKLDNPNQQVLWSLVIKTDKGPKTIGGGQPYHLGPTGHSPYTQTIQHKSTLLVAAAPTGEVPQNPSDEYSSRASIGARPLVALPVPELDDVSTLADWWEKARLQAACWLFIPRGGVDIIERDHKIMLKTGQTFLGIVPFSQSYYLLSTPEHLELSGKSKILEQYHVLVVADSFSGYALEVYEKSDFGSFAEFADRFASRSTIRKDPKTKMLDYHNLKGDRLQMYYNDLGLRPEGKINGKALDFDHWNPAGGYTSPVLNTGDGALSIEMNGDSFRVNMNEKNIVYEK